MITSSLLNGALMLGLWMGGAPPAQPAHWKMVAASGRVETRLPSAPEDRWLAVRRGDRVAPFTRLRTLERARATLTRSGDLILVDAGSEIIVPDAAPGKGTSVMQRSGNAIYKVAPRSNGERFEVRTPYLVAGVKGTRFSVQIRDGSAAVNVLEGVVEVTSTITGESRDLTPGQWVIVDAHDQKMELNERAPDSVVPPVEKLPGPVDDIVQTSVRLDSSLEKETELLADAVSADLWCDLGDGTGTLTGTVDRTLDSTLTRLDTATQDTKTSPTLLDVLPLPRKRP